MNTDLKRTIAVSVLSVLFGSVGVGLIAYPLAAPDRASNAVFMYWAGAGLMLAVALQGWMYYRRDKQEDKESAEKSVVFPNGCPDMWTSTWNVCSEDYVCSSDYTTADGHRYSVLASPEIVDLGEFRARGESEQCNGVASSSYSWTDISNKCASRSAA